MRTLIIIFTIVVLFMLVANRFIRTPPAKIKAFLHKFALTAGVAILILLVVTGRLHWFFGLLGGLIPLVQRVFAVWKAANYFGGKSQNKSGPSAPQSSNIETQFLSMSLDHSTGQMSGTVLKGKFSGKNLSELKLNDLLQILVECKRANDQDSIAVLESYLDRYFSNQWRNNQNDDNFSNNQSAQMSDNEAYEILGLKPGATVDEIKSAYKKLIQQFHPDRGGSSYLASQINRAKKILLKKR